MKAYNRPADILDVYHDKPNKIKTRKKSSKIKGALVCF
jgi:hypothetical protein